MKKRILSILLICCMVFSLFPVSALAASSDMPFTDVNTTDWFYKEVCYVYDEALMQGTSATTFDPDGTTSRGMIVTILYRLEGEPALMNDNVFTDVESGSWYEKAVVWANGKGIVEGYGNGKFGPDDPITREQLAAIMYRYAGYKEYDVSEAADLSGLVDSGKISGYALDAMKWANAAGLITGIGASKLDPQGYATRAQVAAIFYRFCGAFVAKDTCKLTFDLNYKNAGTYTTQNVKVGEKAAQPTAPTRSGYTFAGWYTKDVGGTKFNFGTAITADLTLYAHWMDNYVPTYTVTFDMQGHGEQIAALTGLYSGAKVTAPDAPTEAGYTFEGWYKEAACETAWTFESDTITALTTTLYAKWTAKDTAIEETMADGTEIKADGNAVTVTSGDDKTSQTLTTAQATELAGKINNLLKSTAVADFSGDGLEESTKIETTGLDAIITALKDAASDATAKDNLEEKTSADVDLQIKVVLSAVNVKATDDLTVTSMEFDVTPIATTTVKDSSGKTVSVTADVSDCLTTEVTFRLPIDSSLKADGNSIAVYHEGEFLGNYEIKGDAPNTYIEIQSKDFSKYGYQLWNENNAGAKIGTTLYFKFADAVAKVANNETITLLKPATGSVAVGREVNFTVDKNDKEFNATVSAGTDYALYKTDETQSPITYKCFPVNTEFTITYKDQGDAAFSGTHGAGYPTTHTYGTATTLVAPTKSGYAFKGWFTTSDCTGAAVTSLGAEEYAANITLYAKWVEIKTVTEILPSGFPETVDFAWVNADGLKAYKDGDNIKVGNLTLGKDTTVTKSGDNYVCKSGDATVTFKVKDGAAESITVTDSGDSNGTYIAPETKKLSEILPSGFPETADSAWVNADGLKAYKDGDNIKVGNLTLGKDTTVTKSGDNYVCKSGDATVTFKVKDGAAESITVTGQTDSNGTYAVPTFKAVYNTAGGANTLTFYYDNKAHSGEGITVYEGSTGDKYLFDGTKNNGAKWGYNDNRGEIKSVVIDASVAGYKGLTSTTFMFQGMTTATNISGAEYLDVSNVTDMSYMFNNFGGGSSGNPTTLNSVPNVSGWNTGNVTNMTAMFESYGNFSSSLDKVPNVSNWNTGNVTDMSFMFQKYGHESQTFNAVPAVSNWNTGNVTSMTNMFMEYGHKSTALDTVPDVSNWNTGNVTNMKQLFNNYGDTSTKISCELDLSGWDLSKISETNGVNVFNFNPSTFNVTIPAKTGEKSNDGDKWYYGDGTNSIAPPEGKTFTLPVYTVTFDLNGITGTAPEAQTIIDGEKVTKPADPTDTIHTFAGWYKTKNTTTGVLSDLWDFTNDTVTADMTLYAQWTRNISAIVGTNTGIPTVTDFDWNNAASASIPETAWIADEAQSVFWVSGDNSGLAMLYTSQTESGTAVHSFGFDDTDTFAKVGDTYVYSTEFGTATCTMTDGKLTSMKFAGNNLSGSGKTDFRVFNGTYAAPVKYMAWDETNKQLVEKKTSDFEEVTNSTDPTNPYFFDLTLKAGKIYVVKGDIERGKITVNGTISSPTTLIICDGAKLTAEYIIVESNKALVITGQPDCTGELVVESIGGKTDGGNITINGGEITATGRSGDAGIGGGATGNGGTVTINGGTVTATGGTRAAGIGGGDGGTGGTVTINGGTVNATGAENAAGIGGGNEGAGGTVAINGGTVTAKGTSGGAGIGGGDKGDAGGTVTINGGKVNATGSQRTNLSGGAAGIGGGQGSYDGTNVKGGAGGTVTINGGTVTATGSGAGAGIGGGWCGDGGIVTINGGTVTATGGTVDEYGGAGIGGGDGYSDGDDVAAGNGGTVTINGGNVTATAGKSAEAIGKSKYGTDSGTVTFGEGVDFTINAGADEDNTSSKTTTEYAGDHSAAYVSIKEAVSYMAWDETNKKLVKESTADGIEVTNETTTLDAGKFYVVMGADVQTGTLTVNGTTAQPTTLILMDGAKLTVTGTSENAGIKVESGKALVITGQKLGTGELIANGGEAGAGIGGGFAGNGGTVTINGGTVTATGGTYGAGIGGGKNGDGGTVTINGGSVTATGKEDGAGIGAGKGKYNAGGNVTINGGTVTANGGNNAAGIGGGNEGAGGNVIINGGIVTATGKGGGAAIGKGRDGTNHGTVTFGTAVDFLVKAGTAAPGEEVEPGDYENNHSAAYVSIKEAVKYKAWDETNKKLVEKKASDYIEVTSETEELEGGKFYVVKDTVTATKGLGVSGTVDNPTTLILADGAQLTVGDGQRLNKGITVKSGKALIITCQSGGTGKLVATGSTNVVGGTAGIGGGGNITIIGGTVTANGASGAAGIGGGQNGAGGTVTIYGGEVTATGGSGAGIGGGSSGAGGNITINGGTVTATGGRGAGIGGGANAAGGNITINGGTVTATGGTGAGIGGGTGGAGGNITINNGTVTATCDGDGGAGIGGGDVAAGGNITINGGTVNATGSIYGAGIGGGSNNRGSGGDAGAGGTITITGGTVTATGDDGAGIGGGQNGAGGTVTIKGGKVTATGGVSKNPTKKGGGAGIGGGGNNTASGVDAAGAGGTITITGGEVTATGKGGGAGIGGGSKGAGGTVTIEDGEVTATSGMGGAGIGGGYGKDGGTVTITGGTVNATSNMQGAGIGGGFRGAGGNITINGGTVTATGGDGGAGIGGGWQANGGTVIINGGTVTATSVDSYNKGGGAGIGGGGGLAEDDGAGNFELISGGNGGEVTINGGNVTATGGIVIVPMTGEFGGAGIGGGGGYQRSDGKGGTVNCNGGNGGTVTINGGSVTATGNEAIGMGACGTASGTVAFGEGVACDVYAGDGEDNTTEYEPAEYIANHRGDKYVRIEESKGV